MLSYGKDVFYKLDLSSPKRQLVVGITENAFYEQMSSSSSIVHQIKYVTRKEQLEVQLGPSLHISILDTL